MRNARRPSRRAALLVLLLLPALAAAPGCVPYTTGYVKDPRTASARTGLDRSAAAAGPPEIAVERSPSAASPDLPVTFRVTRTLSGPEARISTVKENRYRNEWSPLLIPMGALIVPTAPLAFVGGILSGEPDKAWKMIFDGGDDPCRHAMFGQGLRWLVGISPGCAVVESRTAEAKDPTGKTVSETVPLSGAEVKAFLSAAGEETGEWSAKLDPDGRIGVEAAPSFRRFRGTPRDVTVTLRVEGGVERSVPLDPEVSRLLFLPVEGEREGDKALAEGRPLAALEHFSRAYGASAGGSEALLAKVCSTYRSLPVKPALPEEARRLVVQGEALAKNDDTDGAVRKLVEALRIAPWYPPARHNLALAQAMKGDYRSAIASMNLFAELTPDAAAARQARDKVYAWEAVAPVAAGPDAGAASGGVGMVGLLLAKRDGKIVVEGAVPGSPAAAAGLRAGDVLVRVNGVSTEGMDPADAAARVRGNAGAPVTLELARPSDGSRIDVTVKREASRPAPEGAAAQGERRGR